MFRIFSFLHSSFSGVSSFFYNSFFPYRERIVDVVQGWGVLTFVNWLYDYPVWIFGIEFFGVFWGGLFLTIGAGLINVVLLYYHRFSRSDWLGMELLERSVTKFTHRHISARLRYFSTQQGFFSSLIFPFLWLLNFLFIRCRKSILFVLFSMEGDSFFAVAYLRSAESRRTFRFILRDWVAFGASTLISGVYWTGRQFAIWELLKRLFCYFGVSWCS
ncbi:MAG: hypothetical protein KC736_01445 [Candidatus Moranbacteria bacterium]|nr:hypothetical protein [Candidatus Moranbacteria bacterium]